MFSGTKHLLGISVYVFVCITLDVPANARRVTKGHAFSLFVHTVVEHMSREASVDIHLKNLTVEGFRVRKRG